MLIAIIYPPPIPPWNSHPRIPGILYSKLLEKKNTGCPKRRRNKTWNTFIFLTCVPILFATNSNTAVTLALISIN
jgi:hypothetical protein